MNLTQRRLVKQDAKAVRHQIVVAAKAAEMTVIVVATKAANVCLKLDVKVVNHLIAVVVRETTVN